MHRGRGGGDSQSRTVSDDTVDTRDGHNLPKRRACLVIIHMRAIFAFFTYHVRVGLVEVLLNLPTDLGTHIQVYRLSSTRKPFRGGRGGGSNECSFVQIKKTGFLEPTYLGTI